MPGGEDTATGPGWADRGPYPRSGERTGARARRGSRALPLIQHATAAAAADRRWQRRTGSGETCNGLGPRRAREARHTRALYQGAAGGQQTEADGRTETGTDGVRPREANATEPAAEVGWPRATTRGMAKSDLGGTRVCSQGPPRDLTARGLPAQGRSRGTPGKMDWRPHPHGARAHRHRHTQSRSRPGRPLSRRVPAAPTALTSTRLPARSLCQGSEGTAPPGEATGRRRPGDDTHVRRGRLCPRQGKGTRAIARAG